METDNSHYEPSLWAGPNRGIVTGRQFHCNWQLQLHHAAQLFFVFDNEDAGDNVCLTRRHLFQMLGALSLPLSGQTKAATGISLNEDNSHYYFSRAGQKLDSETVASFVDQYAGTGVRELMLSANSQRTSYGSKVWDPIWLGYDPAAPDDQPLFRSMTPDQRVSARKWVQTAWDLNARGIDPYALWIARCRKHKIAPWISMRMNDLHNVDDPDSYMHSTFWRRHPEFRRVPYRVSGWTDRAFDYGHAEVRDYHMKLVRELVERYDMDGLELDWMRFGYHFRPGFEAEGAPLLTGWIAEIRQLLNVWERKRGHRIRLGARVPTRPQTALGLGLDAMNWARQGLVDMLVVTPFWQSIETDIPIELWRQLCGSRVTLAGGLEVLIRHYPDFRPLQMNSLETVRGAAASLLSRGADRVYLFNYMDSDTAMSDLQNYPALLRECGSEAALAGKPRRHVLTYADTWAPGEARSNPLPSSAAAGQWLAFRIHTGPKAAGAVVRLAVTGAPVEDVQKWDVRLNGEVCKFWRMSATEKPRPDEPMLEFRIPNEAVHSGYNLVEMHAGSDGKVIWVEIAMWAHPALPASAVR